MSEQSTRMENGDANRFSIRIYKSENTAGHPAMTLQWLLYRFRSDWQLLQFACIGGYKLA